MVPTPAWDAAASLWRVDLGRPPSGLGRHVIHGDPPPGGLIPAIHAVYALLEELRERRPLSRQLTLPGTGKRTLGEAAAAWLAEKKWSTAGGERWTREVCHAMARELFHYPLAAFVPPAGTRLLFAWKEGVRPVIGPEKYGAKTLADRLAVLRSVLSWCTLPPREWLPAVPTMPPPTRYSGETLRHPVVRWFEQATFRRVRAELYNHPVARSALARELREAGEPDDAAAVRDLVERRKLYLSFALYTGMRKHDLDLVDDASVSPEFDTYWRFARKTGADRAAEEICPEFKADLEAEQQRLGRPWNEGEAICGGPWKNVCRVLAASATRLGLPPFNLRDCRRTFVYIKALAGVSEASLKTLLGHTFDSPMIHEVYLTLQPRLNRNRDGRAWVAPLSEVPAAHRVLAFPTAAHDTTEAPRSTGNHTFSAKSRPKKTPEG